MYVPLKMLFRFVWYFDFACFNMIVVKSLMKKKKKIMMYFQNAYAVLVPHNVFYSGNPFQKNDGSLLKIQLLCSSLVFSKSE